ncbi:MAG: PilZ domain-containing protein [Micrococcales bacterium]|nr:PilZ domain-containing protein [Micrococcales bacterium]
MYELARCVVIGDSGVTLTGYVEHFDTLELAVRFPDAPDGLEVSSVVEVRVLDEVRGEVHFGASVVETHGSLIFLAGLYEIAVRQRRGAARVRVSVPAIGVVTSGAGEPEELALTVLDISATGVRILVADHLAADAEITFPFLVGDTVLELTAQTVWAEESVSGWRYGCRFVASSPRDVELLFRYVLLTQGAQRRQAKESAAAGT